MKLRTTALAVALMASVSCLAVSAQAAPFGGWHGGGGGWHGGGWHGGGGRWAGAGLGFAAGAIVGSALATPYYDGGYYAAGYGYPDYGYTDAPVVYGYRICARGFLLRLCRSPLLRLCRSPLVRLCLRSGLHKLQCRGGAVVGLWSTPIRSLRL